MKMVLVDAPLHFHSQKFYRLAPMPNKHASIRSCDVYRIKKLSIVVVLKLWSLC